MLVSGLLSIGGFVPVYFFAVLIGFFFCSALIFVAIAVVAVAIAVVVVAAVLLRWFLLGNVYGFGFGALYHCLSLFQLLSVLCSLLIVHSC